MSDASNMCQTYCTLCDLYFWSAEARQEHIQNSEKHPHCEKCNKRFAHKHALRIHLTCSSRHHYCSCCERDFRTAAGFRAHVEFAAVHRDDSDDSDDNSDVEEPAEGWEEEVGALVFPHAHTDMDGFDTWDSDEEEENEDTWWEEECLNRTEDYQEEGEEGNMRASDFRIASLDLDSDEDDDGDDEKEEDDDDDDEKEEKENEEQSQNELISDSENGKSVDRTPDIDIASPSVAKAPTASKPKKSKCSKGDGTSYTCPMCLEVPKHTSVTLCGHVFCTHCIKQALVIKGVCPVCRDGVNPYQLRKIFLS